MRIQDAALLALPIATGLNGLIWAEVVARAGGAVATLCAVPAYAVVAAATYLSGWSAVGRLDLSLLIALVALNVVTSTLWLVPLHDGSTRYVSLALIEGAWPVFSIVFAWLIFGRLELDVTSIAGGLLILIGAALVFHRA